MNCQKCSNPGIENQANGKPFWFCRSCRIEIEEPKSGFTWVSDWMSLDSIGATPLPVSQSPAQGPIQAPISPFYGMVNKRSIIRLANNTVLPSPSSKLLWHRSFCIIIDPQDTKYKIFRLEDWLPVQNPQPGDNFCGVDRSVDPIRLAGIRYQQWPSETIVTTIQDCSALVSREGGAADACFLPTTAYDTLRIIAGMTPGVSYIIVHTPYGGVTCYEDLTLDPDTAFLLQMDTWEGINGTLVCKSPGYNARIKLL